MTFMKCLCFTCISLCVLVSCQEDAVSPQDDMSSVRDMAPVQDMSPDMSEQDPVDLPTWMDTAPDLPEDMPVVIEPVDMGADAGDGAMDMFLDDGVLDAPSATLSYTLPFHISIQGVSSSGAVSDVTVTRNVAQVTIDGEVLQGFVYEQQEWSGFSLTLYQALLVSSSSIHAVWFYCEDDTLTWIYHESNLTDMRNQPLQGSCMLETVSTPIEVTLPEVAFEPPEVPVGYEVDGTQLQLHQDGSPGLMTFQGEDYTVYPFEIVDCSEECGQPGWYEVHSFVERRGDGALGFIIYYLREPGKVEAHYGVIWPSFERLTLAYFDATWSVP